MCKTVSETQLPVPTLLSFRLEREQRVGCIVHSLAPELYI